MIQPLKRIEIGLEDGAFRAVLETIPDAVALVESGGRIAAVNSIACRMFGRAEADLLGEPVEILIPERFRDHHPELVQQYFSEPQVVFGSQRFRHGEELPLFGARADGEEFPVEISVGPIETPDGMFAFTVIRDVTEKKRLQAKLKDYNRSLEQEVRERTAELQMKQAELIQSAKMAALGNLAAGVVHEMNSPLGALRSANQSALAVARKLLGDPSATTESGERKPLAAAQVSQLLETLASASEQALEALSRTVGSLRVFARLDDFDDSEADLVEGLLSVVALPAPRSRGRIRIESDCEELPPIRGKHADLNQAVMNVLLNAIEAIDGEGVIRLAVRCQGDAALIEVTDSGRGIVADDLPRIFDPGFTTKGVKVGAGLGLAIAHRILAEHGGTIEVQSQAGEGARVTIRLPFAAAV